MRRPHVAIGLLAALAVALAPGAAAAQPVVADVRVEGNRRVEDEAIRNALTMRKGAPFDARKVQADVRALMKLGYFSDVAVEREGPDDAPVLVYRVVERPAIREWRAEGNEELSRKDLEETVALKAGQLHDPAAVQKEVKKIQEKYVEKGYYLAEVSSRVEERPDNQVDVVFVVNEQAKVQVKEVRFIGNDHVPDGDLEKVMQTREGGLLSFLTSAGTYREEALDRDVQAVQALYLDRGYVTVKVGTPSVALSPDRRFIYVTMPVEEGEQYTIGKIAFDGQLLDQEPSLRKLLKTRSGTIFSRSEVAADLFAIGDVYKDLGHAYANVTPLTATDPEKRIVDLTFEVQPGKVVTFERIDVVGNEKTRDKVIRRELRIYEGERFSGTGLRQSRQRVNALGFFETAEITTKPGSTDDKVIAVVEVKERPPAPSRSAPASPRTRTSSSPGRSPSRTSSAGARPSRSRSSGRGSASSTRSSSSSRTSSTPAGPSRSTSTAARASTRPSPARPPAARSPGATSSPGSPRGGPSRAASRTCGSSRPTRTRTWTSPPSRPRPSSTTCSPPGRRARCGSRSSGTSATTGSSPPPASSSPPRARSRLPSSPRSRSSATP
jgi:outer membrane protein assembly factor BamA